MPWRRWGGRRAERTRPGEGRPWRQRGSSGGWPPSWRPTWSATRRLMERDEAARSPGSRRTARSSSSRSSPSTSGRIVKLMGDGALVEFASVVDAVRCAVADPAGHGRARGRACPRRSASASGSASTSATWSVEADGDLYGDGVNVAARLEQLAEPGGVVVSGTAYDQLRGQARPARFAPLGEQRLKNIARPVRAYRVVLGRRDRAAPRPRRRPSGPRSRCCRSRT